MKGVPAAVLVGAVIFITLSLATHGAAAGPGERLMFGSRSQAIAAAVDWQQVGFAWPGSTIRVSSIGKEADLNLSREWLHLNEFTVPLEEGLRVDTASYEFGPADRVQRWIVSFLSFLAAAVVFFRTHRSHPGGVIRPRWRLQRDRT